MEEPQLIEEGDNQRDVEVAPALISVHPTQNTVAVTVGSDLRVFDLKGNCAISLVDKSGGPSHKDSIRAIRYGANGKLFVSAGDDKIVKVWSAESWNCIATVPSEKRVSAVAISNDGAHVCYADKFGVVWAVGLSGLEGSQAKPASILSHYCSIITSLEFSPDGRYIVSADRDFKIRVTVFPNNPLDGAHEIQSYCLGHTEFVSCLAFISTSYYPSGLLVSGSGDATVRLWDITSGSLLNTCEVSEKAGYLESNGSEKLHYTVTDLCTIPDSTLVAVSVQSLQGIMLLNCDVSAQTLTIVKVVSIPGEHFVPTSIQISSLTGLLWMVSGASNLPVSDCSFFSRVKAISGLNKTTDDSEADQIKLLKDDELPGGAQLLEKLQGSISVESKVLSAATEAVKTAMSNLLIKKHYSVENRDFRKRTRNDKRTKQ